jgi:hypothetical protein
MIDWNDAPAWANWVTMDKDGEWYWWEKMPVVDSERSCWWGKLNGNTDYYTTNSRARFRWEDSLQQRPQQMGKT